MKLKILELFGGIGACSKALERIGIDYEIADYVEIDKYAVKSFNAIHNTNFEPQDICEWNKDIEVDLIMHGSPCQDFSLAGKQAGGDEGSGTRSSLMYETLRIVEKLKPKYVIWENVKNLLSKKHIHNFNNYLDIMEKLGYKNYYKVLNAKDFGIPQNRERVFTVSILENKKFDFPKGNIMDNKIKRLFNFSKRQSSRVVYDENGLCPTLVAAMGTGGGNVPMLINNTFEFPEKQELKLKLKYMLENDVNEKYYLSDKMLNFFYKNEKIQKEKGNGFKFNISDGDVIAKTVTTRAGSRMDDNFLMIKNNTKKGYLKAYEGDGVYTNASNKRGMVQSQMIPTLTTFQDKGVVVKN